MCSPSWVHSTPLTPPQSRIAFSSIASNTGVRSPGDELMICSTSAVAVCCSRASFKFGRAFVELPPQLGIGSFELGHPVVDRRSHPITASR